MKKVLGYLAVAILMGIGGVMAQTGGLGAISTWPGAFTTGGFLTFLSGPQSSVIRATGGTFTCTTGGAITVTNANITANSLIQFSLKTKGGTAAAPPYMTAITPGTSFVATCATNETSVFNYWVLG